MKKMNFTLAFETLTKVWILLLHPPKSDEKYRNMLKKVFNWSEVYLSEVTSFKSHTSVTFIHYVLLSFNWQLVRHFSDLLQLSHFKWIRHFQRWWEQNRCLFVKWLGLCTANVFSKIITRKVRSRSTCYYSENQIF